MPYGERGGRESGSSAISWSSASGISGSITAIWTWGNGSCLKKTEADPHACPVWQGTPIKTAKIVKPKSLLLMAPSFIRAAPFQET